jgi:hypothetical protein
MSLDVKQLYGVAQLPTSRWQRKRSKLAQGPEAGRALVRTRGLLLRSPRNNRRKLLSMQPCSARSKFNNAARIGHTGLP